jgi:PKD repeat protein
MKAIQHTVFTSFIVFLFLACSEKPKADFTWSPLEPKVGEEVNFKNLSINAKKYSWNLGNMAISKETNPIHIYESKGEYIIDLTAMKGVRSDMKTKTIKITE